LRAVVSDPDRRGQPEEWPVKARQVYVRASARLRTAARRRVPSLALAYAEAMLTPPLAESGGAQAALELGPLVLARALYSRRAHPLARAGHAVPRWRRACFLAGLILIGASLLGLGDLADEVLYAHMAEHLLVGDIGALLLVLGLSGPLLAP